MDDLGYHDALAMLDWQIELGADEAILDAPVDRFALSDAAQAAQGPVAPPPKPVMIADAPATLAVDAVALAERAAAAAHDLAALRMALEGFDLCPLAQTATRLVFADGRSDARVMIVTDAPRREEDQQGRPIVGVEGKLLDRMLAAIGLSRGGDGAARPVYVAPMIPWRPPQDRPPTPEEMAMLVPFMRRHIALISPEVLVLMGNHGCQGLLGHSGIIRLRGTWAKVLDRPAIAMLSPEHLLRKPADKALAWADLLALKARLDGPR
ncbi:uracil-DNA glycosylase [uncultured Roseicyclus sp.]|jgi:uracil-DNA glycosylase|uniref:uracil-DNA glycosylase n=1 Tax=uncultured Roseicyclus sp. TaxID=543072 RepID=UPI0026171FFF|nr:uracil-DNA glycosylase [uncultured Roseicyclus sp.]